MQDHGAAGRGIAMGRGIDEEGRPPGAAPQTRSGRRPGVHHRVAPRVQTRKTDTRNTDPSEYPRP